ncbi:PAS domain-containing protein [Pricia sp.]|uniref:PAS domain-containing sensor histidine kinase n=1 Tax=Pricia sp. TaxID=2268138 RepID=UPI0035939911
MLKGPPIRINNSLINQLPKAIVFVNERFEVVHASDEWLTDFKLESPDVFGTSILELFTRTGRDWENALRDCLSGASDETTVHLNLDTTSNDTWFEWTCVPWNDEQGHIIGLIIETEDITQRKLDEAQNKRLRSLLKATCEIGKIGCWEYCFKEDKLTWCEMTRKIHEVSDDFVPTLDNAVQFYKDGHSRNTMAMVLHEATQKGKHWSERLQIISAKGNEIWVQTAGMPIFKDEKLVGFTGTFQNINDQVQSETKTKENELLLRTLVDYLPLNVYIKDTESRKILVNKAECAYLGVDNPEEILGKSDFELYDHDIAQISRNEDLRVMETLKPILSKETTNRKKNGKSTTFLTSKIPLLDNCGKAKGLVGISMDITQIKQKEEELHDLVNVASLQNKKLINFAHIVSHNLRSHSANFAMLLDFLVHEKEESEKANIHSMLTNASDNLMETLENLNEVVAINTNVNLDKKSISLRNKIDTVRHTLSAYLAENSGTLLNEVCDTIKIQVIPAYIDSILMNFITNSVRFKDPKRNPIITMTATGENGYTVLSITDNGLGIDLKKYGDKLFGMYKTFHDHCDARGIGLYIAKNQIEAMNGKVTVESKVGIGSTFKIYFDEKNQ